MTRMNPSRTPLSRRVGPGPLRESALRVLVVDDEPDMAFGLRMNLEIEGYVVAVAESGQRTLALHASFRPHLILLDLKLPDMYGLEVLRRLRAVDPIVRVLIVSCLSEPVERAAGIAGGANDYQIKPFELAELLARVRAQAEHVRTIGSRLEARDSADTLNADFNRLVLDPLNRAVRFRSRVIELAAKPFDLLHLLVEAGGRVVPKNDLLRAVWHFKHMPDTHTVEQHVGHLRRRLHTDPNAPDVILTVYGLGYRINPDTLPIAGPDCDRSNL